MDKILGIDLGTSNSTGAVIVNGRPVMVQEKDGNPIIPSVVSFGHDGRVLVGSSAKRNMVYNPSNTVFSIKRLIGRKFDSLEMERIKKVYPYEIVEGHSGDIRVRIMGKIYTTQEISAFILRYIKDNARSVLQDEEIKSVITVPAYFNDNQRRATKDAGIIAGLNVLRIINEPTAAAIAYGFGRGVDKKVAVYDLGGGTFDISILNISGNIFEVVSTAGDTFLGGDDFDYEIVKYIVDSFLKEKKADLRRSALALYRLKDEAEKAKIRLSTTNETEIIINGIIKDEKGESLNCRVPLSRLKFNDLIFPYLQKTFNVCDTALANARLDVHSIDAVILVGGATRVPIVREAVENYFGKEVESGIDPELVVAIGAAIHGASLSSSLDREEDSTLLIDVTPRSLGVATVDGYNEILIERNSHVPISKSRVFTTTKDNQTSVRIAVYQGESRMIEDNELIGEFILSGLRPAPRGEIKIRVSFDIDTNGILTVSAVDIETGKEHSIKISASTSLSSEEVDELRFDRVSF